MADGVRSVVLVEGRSDQIALETLARRRGADLAGAGVAVVSIGGASGIGRALDRFGPAGLDVHLAGLCDVGEERLFRHHLQRAGLDIDRGRAAMERAGFFVCDADLEDELIRALGARRVEEVIAGHGELGSFRTLQRQPAQRGRNVEAQLRRFMGTQGGRKLRYAALLVDALDLEHVPAPLGAVLAHALSGAS